MSLVTHHGLVAQLHSQSPEPPMTTSKHGAVGPPNPTRSTFESTPSCSNPSCTVALPSIYVHNHSPVNHLSSSTTSSPSIRSRVLCTLKKPLCDGAKVP